MTCNIKIALIFLIFITSIVSSPCKLTAQNNAGKLGLEITKIKFGLNVGPYRGRTPETDGLFNQGIALLEQVYFPFQLAVDYRKNFSDSNSISNEYNSRVFLIRPSALLHYVDNGSYAIGAGIQFSFLMVNDFYIEYQMGGVYLEATKAAAPDLNSGFNLHHFASISKPVSRHFTITLGYVHLSGAGLGNGVVSNQDVVTLGMKYNL